LNISISPAQQRSFPNYDVNSNEVKVLALRLTHNFMVASNFWTN